MFQIYIDTTCRFFNQARKKWYTRINTFASTHRDIFTEINYFRRHVERFAF